MDLTSNNFKEAYSDFCQLLNSKLSDIDIIQAKYRLQKAFYWSNEEGYALPPHTINLTVNNRCSFKCKMCDFGQDNRDTFYYKFNVGDKVGDKRNTADMPVERLKSLIDEVEWFKPIIRVSFLEPLLYKPLPELFEHVKSKGLKFWLLTNGFTMTEKMAEDYFRGGLDLIRFSLDGTQEVHDDICGVKNAFRNCIRAAQMLIDLKRRHSSNTTKPDIGFYFTLTNWNYHEMYNLVKYLDKNGILSETFINFQWLLYTTKEIADEHNREFAPICGGTVEESSLRNVDMAQIDLEEVDRQYRHIKTEYISKGYRIHFRPTFEKAYLDKYLSNQSIIDNPRCYTPWYNANINCFGDVNCFHHCLIPSAGNIFDNELYDIWNGPPMREQRVLLKEHCSYPGCKRCWGVYSLIDQERRYS